MTTFILSLCTRLIGFEIFFLLVSFDQVEEPGNDVVEEDAPNLPVDNAEPTPFALDQLTTALRGLSLAKYRLCDSNVRDVFIWELPLPEDKLHYSKATDPVAESLETATTSLLRVWRMKGLLLLCFLMACGS